MIENLTRLSRKRLRNGQNSRCVNELTEVSTKPTSIFNTPLSLNLNRSIIKLQKSKEDFQIECVQPGDDLIVKIPQLQGSVFDLQSSLRRTI